MKRRLGVATAAAALAVAATPANAQLPVHEHPLTTPAGNTTVIARGVSHHAPCEAFVNFHFNVHRGVFGVSGAGENDVEGKHPLGPIPFQLVFPVELCPLP
ncbi:MAG TPA: hypothetical protein VHF23_07000 [Gaiellaceae bacterium]|jgi:hypothetical protein|nr:hypothetical protein [Gaiellaceae bacterium]